MKEKIIINQKEITEFVDTEGTIYGSDVQELEAVIKGLIDLILTIKNKIDKQKQILQEIKEICISNKCIDNNGYCPITVDILQKIKETEK